MLGLFHTPTNLWVVNISAGEIFLDPNPEKIQEALRFPPKDLSVYSVLNNFRWRIEFSVKRIPTGPIVLKDYT